VVAAAGAGTGLGLDQLELDSAPGGGAAHDATTPGATGGATAVQLAAPRPGPAPTVRVTSSTTTKLHLRISGATHPYWLVLGESINNGWKATVDTTGHDLGKPTLVDGFGNGWLVTPSGPGPISVTLTWAPQFDEEVVLALSGLVTLACLVLALRPRRRRSAPVSEDGATVGAVATEGAADGLDSPTLVNPFASSRSVPLWQAGVVGAACGLLAGLIVPQAAFVAIFLGVTLCTAASLAVPRLRGLLGLVVIGFAVGAVVYIVVTQASQHFPSAGWTGHFEPANVLVWTAVVFLGADAVVELVRRLRR